MGTLPLNENGKVHGYWERFWTDDEIVFKCNYVNGKLDGYLEYGSGAKMFSLI